MTSEQLISLFGAAVLAGAAVAAPEAQAQSQGAPQMTPTAAGTPEARNRALVEAAFASWSAGTGGPYDLLDDAVVWTIVGRSDASRTYPSREAFMRDVIRPFNARMREPLRPTIRQLTTDGDRVIIFFDAQGVARDGQPYVNTYAWFWEMRDGRVARAHAFYDSLAFNDLWRRVSP
ncbi:nuclear transport factor 2 family protein [Phenylobacterium sp.]|uniref:nuclear transport factor 2 family protein n=1 Tax=Phenylobacterium sp. TaxID=1871053 RepID=UPI0035B119B9